MEMWTINDSSSQSIDEIFSNISSNKQLCAGSYNPILNIVMLVVNLPITLIVIVDLFLRRCGISSSPGNSSPSHYSELLFLNVGCSHFLFYIRLLLDIVRNLGGVTRIGQEYITAFHSCSLIGGSLFFTGMCIDLYIAVAHPVVYVNQKQSTKQIQALIFCALVWTYNLIMGTVIVIFDITMYRPLPMASFCATVPVNVSIFVIVLFILHPAGSGKGSQTSKTDKTKKNAIRFVLNSLVIMGFYFLPHICLLIYFSVANADWLYLPCEILPLILMVQISELLTPVIFFYNSGKLHVLAKWCSAIRSKNGS